MLIVERDGAEARALGVGFFGMLTKTVQTIVEGFFPPVNPMLLVAGRIYSFWVCYAARDASISAISHTLALVVCVRNAT